MRGKWKFVWMLLLASVLLVGCSSDSGSEGGEGSEDQVTIQFWHTFNQAEQETISEIIEAFEEAYPHIKVQVQAVPFDQAQNQFKLAAQSGDAPDVFRAEIAWTPEFADLGYLLELDEYVSDEDLADYLDSPMNYNLYDGHIWGVPQATDALALLYNKRMLEEAGLSVPTTMDEFLEAAQALTDESKDQYGFFIRGDAYWVQPFIWAFGGDLIDGEAREVKIAEPGSIEGTQFYVDLQNKYKVTPATRDFSQDYDNMQTGFKEGRIAMILNGPWSTSDILSGSEFSDPDNLGIAPIPVGPTGLTGSPVGGHNYVIYKGTQYPDEAYTFIEFINSAESQAKFAINNNILPTRASAYEIPEVAENRLVADFQAVIEKATNRPVIPEGGAIYTDFTPAIQSAILEEVSVEEALKEVEKAWNQLLGN
ncbi:extracellular solute-binding protein family 1 [Caldalkalibacillus thermarum TA2.A1]|uniref:Maltodextrin-binding protein n=1 Tax=Caldalkalibacillus thermarum (strain TA2.A1) TaxID=986075 RepID=F5L407_CALTT|nr:extracellular solute-binding protein [Caldalkalibacillus thermarum]EGL83927.1 extracellular solute-binding protein family 1 [Caldalkalibacillus thermarum TA2.A1]QZT34982.1 extracellular solute-binding protein [Caldalkalibacillus thermarum TA2.A1]